MSTMRISQLAKTSGVPASTLRYYESTGLLPADRTPAGYRTYGPDAVERLRFIAAAKRVGLSLEDIGDLLHVWESGTCAEVKVSMQPRITTQLAETEARAADLSAFAETLRAALAHLDALPNRTERCDPTCTPPPSRPHTAPAATLTPTTALAPAPTLTPTTAPTPTTALTLTSLTPTASIACTLTSDQLDDRLAQWHEATAGATHHPIENGLRLTLPADRAAALTTLATAEQQCCPFLDFRLLFADPNVHLEVRAPVGAAPLVNHLFAA